MLYQVMNLEHKWKNFSLNLTYIHSSLKIFPNSIAQKKYTIGVGFFAAFDHLLIILTYP